MSDHLYYKELTALAAGGYLSDEECRELRDHLAICPACRKSERAFGDLVRCLWPSRTSLHEVVDHMNSISDKGVRERFLERAEREGIRFSSRVRKKADGPE
jgi:anti-sigma factor RsiW